MRNWIVKFSFLAFLLASFGVAKAQNSSALTGVVTDATGAAVRDANVTLTNPSTGVIFKDKTDSKGSYRFAIVPPQADYTVTIEHAGFSKFVATGLTLQVGLTRTQDVTLKAGEATSIEVSAKNSELTLNTSDASIGNNIDPTELNELPIQARSSVAALFTLQPGVTASGSVTGARTDQSQVTLDGMDVNDISTGTAFASTVGSPVDAIQEFRSTVAGQPPANVTGGGGVFQLVTKSGTNKFHGNLNEYHRDPTTLLLARQFLSRNWCKTSLAAPSVDRLHCPSFITGMTACSSSSTSITAASPRRELLPARCRWTLSVPARLATPTTPPAAAPPRV
jgi:hypothetical protein